MEKLKIAQTAPGRAGPDHRKHGPAVSVLAFCLLIGGSLLISTALLGASLGRFSKAETNVIPLIPSGKDRGAFSAAQAAPSRSEAAGGSAAGGTASPRNTSGAQAEKYHGDLRVDDEKPQTWGIETQVDLFQNSYDQTVTSGDGEKVIAPGTTNTYGFSLHNNGGTPLEYTISLKVDTYYADQGTASQIPLEWRLLSGGTPVTGWQGYNERTQTLDQSTLAARHQNSYTIEWRWAFERGEGMDRVDTDLGDRSVTLPLGAKATITVLAEQVVEADSKPTGPWWLPKTGDSFNLPLHLTVLAVSACGLLALFAARRRKKNADAPNGGGNG